MNYQRLRYVFPGFAAGLVILCLSGGSFTPQATAAAELRDQESTAKGKEPAVENQKESGASDKQRDGAKIDFGPNRPSVPQGAVNFEQEKHEPHGHDSCEELHQAAAIEACKKRREQSR